MGVAEILGVNVQMIRIQAAVTALVFTGCQPLPANPGASPRPTLSIQPSSGQTTASPSPRPSPIFPTPVVQPSPTTFPTPIYTEVPVPIRTLPPEARPTPLPEPPLLSSALTVLAGSDAPGFQDGKGDLAKFNEPKGLDIDAEGNLYVADTNNHVIRRVSPQGEVITIAGTGQPGDADGIGKQAQFRYPQRLTLDNAGNIFVIEDISLEKDSNTGQQKYVDVPVLRRIRKVDVSQQKVTQLVLSSPDIFKRRLLDIAWQSGVKHLYVSGDNLVVEIQAESNVNQITNDKTFDAMNVGDYGSSRFSYSPEPVLTNIISRGDLFYLTDFSNQILWKMSLNGSPSFLAGGKKYRGEGFHPDNCGDFAMLFYSNSLSLDTKGNLYVGESTMLRKVNPDGCASTVQIKDKEKNINNLSFPNKINDLVIDSKNIIYILSSNKIYKLDLNARAAS